MSRATGAKEKRKKPTIERFPLTAGARSALKELAAKMLEEKKK